MLSFRPVTLKDKAEADCAVFAENSRSADFNFGNIYIWDKEYRQLLTFEGGRMFTKLRYGRHPAFAFPVGSGDIKPAIELLREFAAYKKYPLVIYGITEENRNLLDETFPGRFSYTEDPDCADYIYLAEKLATYSGKALHGKKNHCNRFEAEHSWEFVAIDRNSIPLCLDMLTEWTEENSARLDPSIAYEHDALIRAFSAYEELGLEGGILLADGKVAGFSVGEVISDDCFDVHFEKADIGMNGAYPMVCREMCRMVMDRHPNIRYINREDDMGFESLRKSKLSYRPEYLLRKYRGRWNGE